MSSASWAHAFAYTMANEGSTYVEDPTPTLRGVTLATLTAWRGRACTAADVKALSLSETQAIYAALYWAKINGELIGSDAVATTVFDAAVNVGVGQAVKRVQNILQLAEDGVFGPKTLAAVNGVDPRLLVQHISVGQQAFYVSLVTATPAKKVYLATWLRRAALYQLLIA